MRRPVFRQQLFFYLSIGLGLVIAFAWWPRPQHSTTDAPFFDYRLSVYSEDAEALSIEDILTTSRQGEFQALAEDSINMRGVAAPQWFKVDLSPSRPLDPEQRLLMYLGNAFLRDLHVYVLDDHDRVLADAYFHHQEDLDVRRVQDHHFVVPLDALASDMTTLYIRASVNIGRLKLPIEFMPFNQYLEQRFEQFMVHGLYFGLMASMILYNLFVYFSTRQLAYLFYIGFIGSFCFHQLSLTGVARFFIWPDAQQNALEFLFISANSGMVFGLLFAQSFLRLRQAPRLWRASQTLVALCCAMLVGSFVLPATTVTTINKLLAPTCSVFVIVAGIVRYRQRLREARFYLLAWLSLTVVTVVTVLKEFGVIPQLPVSGPLLLQLGSATEAMLLSLALADRLNILSAELADANRSLARHSQHLETVVEQRTQSLSATLAQLEQANGELARLSVTDTLTGLHNRRHFDQTLANEMARRRSGEALSLILLDIDHFKRINDTWGHTVGDRVIQAVAQSMQRVMSRDQDCLCRYGGEEFAAILPETPPEGAAKVAERLRRHIQHLDISENNTRMVITVSLGVASAAQANSAQALVEAADSALYRAKESGRNRVQQYNGDLEADHAEGQSTRSGSPLRS